MPKSFQAKFIAAFLLLFVCMNAGGAVCVAYCRSVVLAAAEEHCPLPKKETHCDKTETLKNDGPALAATKFDCCPMLVSIIPGTLETNRDFNIAAATATASNILSPAFAGFTRHRFLNIPAYRGPPKDERVLHITNRTLRI
jgi:hypothetical protein